METTTAIDHTTTIEITEIGKTQLNKTKTEETKMDTTKMDTTAKIKDRIHNTDTIHSEDND